MPFVKLRTNIPRDQLSFGFMQNFAEELSKILSKPKDHLIWSIETDLEMSKVRADVISRI